MASTDRLQGVRSTKGFKAPTRCATTADITLSGAQTIDDIAAVVDDRVLVKDQSDATENGIYVVANGAWARAEDWNKDNDITNGTQCRVNLGTAAAGQMWALTTVAPVIGTSSMTFIETLAAPRIHHAYNPQSGTSYPLVVTDDTGIVSMSNASANTVTIPTNASVAFPVGTIITIFALGAGTTTIAGDTGVTVQGNGGSGSGWSADIQTRYNGASIVKIDTDTWMITGDIDTVAA